MLQPMSGKELEYIADSISNEDLLLKQNAITASSTSNQQLKQLYSQAISQHQQHIQTLNNLFAQHQQLAPSQPQG
ncbi:ferritin-like metal-binding protein YciE [Paenibacillus phyllosphaerae]|uniref:Ferritin-like metal-binding protein YciE n=1 Tax=Paenibacillus phyllosphaerae TaxID=274593 RepID=A0A7W5B4M1_9BACL|nr:hypothetical protein [Paenibacillus phyllosphaerae]MBB3114334.1 ferritin-like metal-binding protein YciE [Paenibacillus phyllosphaerae]